MGPGTLTVVVHVCTAVSTPEMVLEVAHVSVDVVSDVCCFKMPM